MSAQLEPFELDMLMYKRLCKKHGKPYTEDKAEDYAMCVARRIIEGKQSEKTARLEAWNEFNR